MNQRDNTFFEAYKRLDRLCRDILNCQNGVSEYIQQMDKTPQAQYTVTNWEKDYKMLKHIRWVRNQPMIPQTLHSAQKLIWNLQMHFMIES